MSFRTRRLVHLLVLAASLGGVPWGAAAADFFDDFESGSLPDARWQRDSQGGCEMQVQSAEVGGGQHALRMDAATDSRCEVVPRMYEGFFEWFQNEPFGEERWYRFKTYLAGPWVPQEKNEVLAQWHGNRDKLIGENDGRGPPLAIRIYGDQFRITSGWDAAFYSKRRWIARNPLWVAPVVTDRWLAWTFEVVWSWEDDGLVKVWLDGELIVDYRGPTTYNDLRGVYLKLGPYHPAHPRVFYLDDVALGSAAAAPEAAP